MNILLKNQSSEHNMHHFKAFNMINLQYEVRIGKIFLIKQWQKIVWCCSGTYETVFKRAINLNSVHLQIWLIKFFNQQFAFCWLCITTIQNINTITIFFHRFLLYRRLWLQQQGTLHEWNMSVSIRLEKQFGLLR